MVKFHEFTCCVCVCVFFAQFSNQETIQPCKEEIEKNHQILLKGVKWRINEVRKTTAISKILFEKSKQTDDDDATAAVAACCSRI